MWRLSFLVLSICLLCNIANAATYEWKIDIKSKHHKTQKNINYEQLRIAGPITFNINKWVCQFHPQHIDEKTNSQDSFLACEFKKNNTITVGIASTCHQLNYFNSWLWISQTRFIITCSSKQKFLMQKEQIIQLKQE